MRLDWSMAWISLPYITCGEVQVDARQRACVRCKHQRHLDDMQLEDEGVDPPALDDVASPITSPTRSKRPPLKRHAYSHSSDSSSSSSLDTPQTPWRPRRSVSASGWAALHDKPLPAEDDETCYHRVDLSKMQDHKGLSPSIETMELEEEPESRPKRLPERHSAITYDLRHCRLHYEHPQDNRWTPPIEAPAPPSSPVLGHRESLSRPSIPHRSSSASSTSSKSSWRSIDPAFMKTYIQYPGMLPNPPPPRSDVPLEPNAKERLRSMYIGHTAKEGADAPRGSTATKENQIQLASPTSPALFDANLFDLDGWLLPARRSRPGFMAWDLIGLAASSPLLTSPADEFPFLAGTAPATIPLNTRRVELQTSAVPFKRAPSTMPGFLGFSEPPRRKR